MIRPPPRSTLFPTPTLFQSAGTAFPACSASVGPEGRWHAEPAELAPVLERRGPEVRPVADHRRPDRVHGDRKSTRLNSSHANISYAVFCLKKKKLHLTTSNC